MKQDHRRVSEEIHEIAYCRLLAKKILMEYAKDETEVRRVATAYLKATRGYTRRKKWV